MPEVLGPIRLNLGEHGRAVVMDVQEIISQLLTPLLRSYRIFFL
jgi:hypothetical protein